MLLLASQVKLGEVCCLPGPSIPSLTDGSGTAHPVVILPAGWASRRDFDILAGAPPSGLSTVPTLRQLGVALTLELPGTTPLRVVSLLVLERFQLSFSALVYVIYGLHKASGAMFPKYHLWIARMSGDPAESEDSQLQLLDTCLH